MNSPVRSAWPLVVLLVVWVMLAHFNRMAIAVAGTEVFIAYGLVEESRMGLVYTAFLVTYTLCMLPGGWLIDRVGPKLALTILGLGMGTCVVLTGAVGWLGGNADALWLALMATRSLAGVFSAPLHPAAARSVSYIMPITSRSLANGLITAGALVGITATYPLFGAMLDYCDWTYAFVLSGMVMIGFAILWQVVATYDPTSDKSSVRTTAPPSTVRFVDLFQYLRDRRVLLLSLSYAAVGYFQYMFFYWMQYFFTHELHMAEGSRGASATVTLAMAVGMLSGGWCADLLSWRFGQRVGRRTMAVGGMLGSAVLALVAVQWREPQMVVSTLALSLALLGLSEGVFWTCATEFGGRAGGSSAAFMNTFGNGVGALAPWLTPYLMRDYGLHGAIGVACAVCAAGGLLWLAFDPA